MRIGGVEVNGLPREILVLPRGDQEIVFEACALADWDEFNALCPEPKPPGIRTRDGFVPDKDDPTYKQILTNYKAQQFAFLVIRSLEPSEVEWEIVDVSNPSTWKKWSDELQEAGLTQIEVNRVIQLVLDANCLNEARLKEARELFVRGRQQAEADSSGLLIEQGFGQSGEPALD
jgi:hypothetical protein